MYGDRGEIATLVTELTWPVSVSFRVPLAKSQFYANRARLLVARERRTRTRADAL